MFKSIIDDVKDQFSYGNNITRLIVINVLVFIVLYIIFAGIALATGPNYAEVQNKFISYFMLPADPVAIIKQPWSIFTHMFLHRGFFHILWNMLILLWFGRIFGDLMGDQRVVPLYLLGGLMGAVFLVLGYFMGITGGLALGASAAVMAIVIASAIVAPDYTFHLILIGPVKLKFIALFMIILDLVGIANMDNTGGHLGHIGGMVMGWIFVNLVNSNNDPSPWFNSIFDWFKNLFSGQTKQKKSPLKVRHKATVATRSSRSQQNAAPTSSQDKLDSILDKISKKGIKSLTKEEKEFLDQASKND